MRRPSRSKRESEISAGVLLAVSRIGTKIDNDARNQERVRLGGSATRRRAELCRHCTSSADPI